MDKQVNYLHSFLRNSAHRSPQKIAVIGPDGTAISYQELFDRATCLSDILISNGANKGDRIGLLSTKSIDKVIAIFGILMAGCAYIPVDPGSPIERNSYIFNDCGVSFILGEPMLLEPVLLTFNLSPEILNFENGTNYQLVKLAYEKQVEIPGFISEHSVLSYILYTSGSTGNPKGVVFTHEKSLEFVNWCISQFKPNQSDIFSSIAPFHFDLSTHDIYVSIAIGATLVLIDDKQNKQPALVAEIIAKNKISICYTTPSTLRLLIQFGKLENHNFNNLRIVHFAGEVFPVKHLRSLKEIWAQADFYNLYGPTETNVCTWFKIPEYIADNQVDPFPIGQSCQHFESKIFNINENIISTSREGELCISGKGIMAGYWNLPEKMEEVFFNTEEGKLWYRTGDIVQIDEENNFVYKSRKDRMVKRRGYRVELGEIENALYKNENVIEAAVISVPDEENGILIKAFIGWNPSVAPSLIQIKSHCANHLPNYMIPDKIIFKDSLPKTSTDKLDYQKLISLQ